MPTQRILHPEWRDQNATTKYPFSDEASLTNSEEDSNFIHEGVFLDAALYPIGGEARMHLSKVEIADDRATLFVGDFRRPHLASGEINLLDPDDNVRLEDPYGRGAGILVSEAERLLSFQGWSPGEHLFRPEQTEFCARVCWPLPEIGVRGFLLDDGSVLDGDVWMIGGPGVVLSQKWAEEPDPLSPLGSRPIRVIRVDVVGDPLFRRTLCGESFKEPRFLRTITALQDCRYVTCHPDSQGNISVSVGSRDAADTVLRVRSSADGLVIEAVGEKA